MTHDYDRISDGPSPESEKPMLAHFTFEADDRTFACQIEGGRIRVRQWWWFAVSGESHRFAPFQPSAEETLGSVQSRILSYYRELVARRALVSDRGEAWERIPVVSVAPERQEPVG